MLFSFLLFLQWFTSSPICLGLVYIYLHTIPILLHVPFLPSFNILHLPISPASPLSPPLFSLFYVFVCAFYSQTHRPVSEKQKCAVRAWKLQKEQKGRAELSVPRHRQLVPKQEEKTASVCLCWLPLCPCGDPRASLHERETTEASVDWDQYLALPRWGHGPFRGSLHATGWSVATRTTSGN